jgi:hypothetical protein
MRLYKLLRSHEVLLGAAKMAIMMTVPRSIGRNIKGAHFAVGCGYSYHHLAKGAPL